MGRFGGRRGSLQRRRNAIDCAGMFRTLIGLVMLCALAVAQDKDDLRDRVARLEKLLQEERARGAEDRERLRELEVALDKSTQTLAQSQDRRTLEREIEHYLDDNPPRPSTGPSESRLNISGGIVMSYRYTSLTQDAGNANTFAVEERYIRFVYRYDEKVTARFYTDGSLAELEYIAHDLAQFNVGVVVVPFGQFNQRSFPDTFDTLSRPLLYLGDEDIFITPDNHPRPVFRSLYSDAGIVMSGNHWRGEDQIYYAAFITNGLVGVNDLAGGSGFSDNNESKQVGARVTYTNGSLFERARVGIGGSAMGGRYDSGDMLAYRMYGIEFLLVVDRVFSREGSLTVRAEYVYAPRETLYGLEGDPGTLVNGTNRTRGAYVLVEARLDRAWMVYVQFDWMQQTALLVNNGLVDPSEGQVTTRIYRYSVGVVRKFALGIVLKFEYAFWDFDLGEPDAHRFSTQLVVPF